MPFARTELVRLLKIHREIAEGRYPSLDSLSDLCNVHTRTIKRDLKMLRDEFLAPLEHSRTQGGYHYTRPFSLAPAPFSEQEMLALSITMEIADIFRNAPFVDALKAALEQLRLMYPESMVEACGDIPACISCVNDPAPPESLDTLLYFNELLSAMKTRRRVRMHYYTISRDAEDERIVDPYLLYLYRGMWYLHAFCHLRGEVRDFALWRIKGLHTLHETGDPPDLPEIRQRLARRFANIQGEVTEVTVAFDAHLARWIRERIWHPSQQLEDQADGGCTLTMTVAGLDSVARWVLGFGQHARPLAPLALVRAVSDEVRAMARMLPAEEPSPVG